MQFVIEVRGNDVIQQKLRKLGPSLLMMKSAMDDIGELVANYAANEGYASQGGVFGLLWPRLSPKYAVWKAKKYPGRGPLELTGAMKAGFYHVATDTQVTVSNTTDYYKYHQSDQEPRTRIPRRLMAAINEMNQQAIVSIVETEVRRKIDAVM